MVEMGSNPTGPRGLAQGSNAVRTLSVIVTLQCPAACEHCGTLSHPKALGHVPLEIMKEAIDEAASLDFANVVFTGGEPMMRPADVLAAISHAKDLGLSTRTVTNAFWAVDMRRAHHMIDELVTAGLDEINFSTGDQHARFVPLANVRRATKAAQRAGLVPHVMVELTGTGALREEHVRAELLNEADDGFSIAEGDFSIIVSPWMPLDPDRMGDIEASRAITARTLPCRTGCESILQTYTLYPDGFVAACCGLGCKLVEELHVAQWDLPGFLKRAIECAESDLLKHWLRVTGPEKILAWAAQFDPGIEWEGKYAHRCQPCLRIYKDPAVGKVIRQHFSEAMPDILFQMWIDKHIANTFTHDKSHQQNDKSFEEQSIGL